MKNILSKLASGFRAFLRICSKYQMSIQSTIFWIVAIMNFSSDRFWLFAVPAIIFSGLGDIIEELRKSNTEQNGKS
jgi:hypothetical protein